MINSGVQLNFVVFYLLERARNPFLSNDFSFILLMIVRAA